jgi:hypothetical protein
MAQELKDRNEVHGHEHGEMVTGCSLVACASQYLTFKLDEELFAVAKRLMSTMPPKA